MRPVAWPGTLVVHRVTMHGEAQRPVALETVDHTADLEMRVRADSPAALYAAALVAFGQLLAADLPETTPAAGVPAHDLAVDGPDDDLKLRELLAQALLLFEQSRFVPTSVTVTGEDGDGAVRAHVRGVCLPRGGITTGHDIKAVTYHHLRFAASADGGYEANVVVDV
jgi:SHS2 domain-containing protein